MFLQVNPPSVHVVPVPVEDGVDAFARSIEEMTLDPQKEKVRLEEARLDKLRLDTEVKNKEKKMEELKKEIEEQKKEKQEKEKKKQEKEKKMEELATKVEEALASKAAVDEQIIRLKLELARTEANSPASSSDGDKPQRQIGDIKADIRIKENENARYEFTIARYTRLDGEWTRLNQECLSVDRECNSLTQKHDRLDRECDKLRTKLGKLLEKHPFLSADSSKQPDTGAMSKVREVPISLC